MKKTARRLFCGAVASVVLLNSGFSVGAAGLRDIFDAEYYASKYSDLKEAYGSDEEALYQHFINYGIKEGRVMNPVIDVVKYREQYKDLQAAFGDDWDAYINHYFTYGVNEHRENGTDFDLLAYLNAYGDLQAAYGNDYLALAKHYEKAGIHENRVKASKTFVRMEQEAKQSAKEDNGNGESVSGNDQGNVKQAYDVREGYPGGKWDVFHYDGNDRLIYELNYGANGEYTGGTLYIYDEAGKQVESGECTSDGSLRYVKEKYVYDSAGNMVQILSVNEDNLEEFWLSGELSYDSNGNVLTEVYHNYDGSIKSEKTYTYVNNILSETWDYRYLDGAEYQKRHSLYNEQEKIVECHVYDREEQDTTYGVHADTITYEYAEDGSWTKSEFWNGSLLGIHKYDSRGRELELTNGVGDKINEIIYHDDGTVEAIESYFSRNFNYQPIIRERRIWYTTFDSQARKVIEEYNWQGDLTSLKTYMRGEVVNDYDASYTATFEYAQDGSKVETRYDLDGNVREVINYNSEGERL